MKKNYKTTFDNTPLGQRVVFEIEDVDMESALKEFGEVPIVKEDDKEKKSFKRRSKKKKKVDPNEVYSI
jgi:CBS-domain-containing membrane protein